MNKLLSYISAGIIFLSGCNSKNLKKEDYLNCKWGLYENHDDIWEEYLGEEIVHSQDTWSSWMFYVRKANKENTYGEIWSPDLDGDGYLKEIKYDKKSNKYIETRKIKPASWKYGWELLKEK